MFNKKFSEIDIQDVQNLITNQVTEGQNLEFKREAWAGNDEVIREMLRDISSMANAYGGIIIVGIEEDADGKALQLVEVPNSEGERDRIYSSTLANLQPRIIGLDIKTLEFETEKNIILIKVPNSLNLHQITFKGLYQFWKRHDRQKDKMSVDEVKDAIVQNSLGTEQSKDLLKDRTQAIINNTPYRRFFINAVPLKLENELFKIDNEELRGILKFSSDERMHGWNFNFPHSPQTSPSINGLKVGDENKSLELYRNGYIEGSAAIPDDLLKTQNIFDAQGEETQELSFRNWSLVEIIHSFTKRLKAISSILGNESPYTIQVGLINIKGVRLPQYRESAIGHNNSEWKEENLILPPLTFEVINSELMAKELADRIWQAFGFEHEPYFNDGEFNYGRD